MPVIEILNIPEVKSKFTELTMANSKEKDDIIINNIPDIKQFYGTKLGGEKDIGEDCSKVTVDNTGGGGLGKQNGNDASAMKDGKKGYVINEKQDEEKESFINEKADEEKYLVNQLELLTRFHVSNIGFSDLRMMMKEQDDQPNIKEEKVAVGGRKNVGRGRKFSHYSQDDDFFIAREIENTLGRAHRAESIFNPNQTPTKTTQSLEKKISAPQRSSSSSSPLDKEAGITVIRPKLTKKKSHTGDVDALKNMELKSLGIGRGRERKSYLTDVQLPVGAVAANIEIHQDAKNNFKKSHNNNYFPAFDYDRFNKLTKTTAWWPSNTSVKDYKNKEQLNVDDTIYYVG